MSETLEQQLQGLGGTLTEPKCHAKAVESCACDLRKAATDSETLKGMHGIDMLEEAADGRRLAGCYRLHTV
jgi:hypothetical protein